MPRLERLRISGLRNLRQVDVRLPEGTIWVEGGNGAGKTTLLEAIYLLSRGTSFRGRRYGPVKTHGVPATTIEGWLASGADRWHRRWSLSGRAGREASGAGFSVRLIGASMQALLEGEPDLRRRFVDWNLFHVEPQIAAIRTRYRRIAAQRNAWLRSGGRGLAVWDHEYATVVAEIEGLRARFFTRLQNAFRSVAGEFGIIGTLCPEWRGGLPRADELHSELARQHASDVVRGYSFLSPARGDFRLLHRGSAWVGSRGENKLVGILLQLAADRVVVSTVAQRAVWLVDDLEAELDGRTHCRLLQMLTAVAGQTLVASLSAPTRALSGLGSITLFHVEQGMLEPRDTLP